VQAVFGAEMDGKVNPITTSSKFTSHGIKYVYLIMVMNIALARLYPDLYPRIDLMPEFVWRIKDKVTPAFLQE
jgi:hypothetical protein